MTPMRTAALSIVKLADHLAAPDSRIWVRAMLAELASIESDWVALRWAIGSMHVLVTSSEGNPMTMSEIPAAMKALTSRMTQRTWVGGSVVTAMALFFIGLLPRVTNTLQRTGCALLTIAMLYMLFQLVRARPHSSLIVPTPIAQAAHFGSELERERSFHSGFAFWSLIISLIPGFILLALGRMMANPAAKTGDAILLMLFLVFAALAIPNNQRFATRYAAELQALKKLLNSPTFQFKAGEVLSSN